MLIKITPCKDCNKLKDLYSKIQCTIIHLVRNKLNNRRYNTQLHFSKRQFKDLQVYERVVRKRLFNSTYPSSTIDSGDIISALSSLVYEKNCSQCIDCFPELPFETTTLDPGSSSSSSSSSSTTISP